MISREKPRSGASIAGAAEFSYRLGAYARSHARSFCSSLGRLVATPFSTIIAILVVAVALSLPAIFYVLVDNIRLISGRFVDTKSSRVTGPE